MSFLRSERNFIANLLHRFLVLYVFLYMLPFPLGMLEVLHAIPGFTDSIFARGLAALIGFHGQLMGPVVQYVGEHLTGQKVSLELTGSGDGLSSYIDVLIDVSLALFLSLIWWVWRRSKPISPSIIELNRVFLRYYLFTLMVVYGLVKLIPGGQFLPVGPDRLVQSLGESSPMGLLWTFMGASTAYQMFTGAIEVFAGSLLLFRRTTLLGALLSAAAMTNVFVLNLCYDVPVKLFSFHILLFSLLVAAPDASRLLAFFVTNKTVHPREQKAPWRPPRRTKRVMLALKVIFVVLFCKQHVDSGMTWFNARQKALEHPLRGIYAVESFAEKGMPTDSTGETERWVRVGLTPPAAATIRFSDGSDTRMRIGLDMENSKLTFYKLGTPKPADHSMHFDRTQDGLLKIEGEFEARQLSVTLRRIEEESLLTGRGFHWVSETPFNH